MFGRETLKEVVRKESESTREVIRELREDSLRAWEETREFNREILLRNEKVYTSVIAEMEEGRRQMEEGRRQIQANTKAILGLLDRFDEPGGAAA